MNISSKTVTVLMSTYNGEKYLEDQLNSLLRQKNVDLKILIRDDGSTDNTISILEEYSQKDERISFYCGKNIGWRESFLNLVCNAPKSDYYAFCDQDDVWDGDKLIVAITKLKVLEERFSNIPLLYYSNLRIVDESLEFCRNLHESNFTNNTSFSSLALPVATGCTEVFNFVAKQIVKDNPPYNIAHDRWLFSTCQLLGHTIYDSIPHMSYRQHSNNAVGASTESSFKLWTKRIFALFEKDKYHMPFLLEIWRCYETFLSETAKVKITKIINYKRNLTNYISVLFDRDIKGHTPRQSLFWKIRILLFRI